MGPNSAMSTGTFAESNTILRIRVSLGRTVPAPR